MLPKYSNDIADQYGKKTSSVNSLVPNLGNKNNYVLHHRKVQLYLSLGMGLIVI